MTFIRTLAFAAALTTTLLVTACGSGSQRGDEPNDRGKVTSGGFAREAILPKKDLPDDWRYATEEQFLGKPEMCDVMLEPPGLVGATTQRFAIQAGDRFIIQYSFESEDEKATAKRIGEFAEKAPNCTTFSPGEGITLDVTPITDIDAVGEDFGAVHAQDSKNPQNQRDYVVFRQGEHVTVLISYGLAELADHQTLAAIARAINSHVSQIRE